MMKRQPRVKQIANFWGATTMRGRKMVKAMERKKTPVAMETPKYMIALHKGER